MYQDHGSDKHPVEAEGGLDLVEAALRQTEVHWRALVENAPVAVIVVDEEERIVLWNPAAERLFGWQAREVLGRPLPFHNPDNALEGEHLHQEWLRGVQKSNLRLTRVRRDGTLVEIALDSIPLRDERGVVNRCLALIRDLSEEKAMLAKLADQERELIQAQKMEAVGRLAGGIAHDFNNLLTAISGNADLLLASLDSTDGNCAEVREIADAADRAASLTRQLLAFSRRQVMRPRVVDLNATVAASVRLLGRILGEDVALQFKPSEQRALVRVDPSQIEQVIMNLAVNARDAMPRGGCLTVLTATVEMGEATSSLYGVSLPPGTYRQLTMIDTGCGMDEQTLRYAFEPFFTTKDPGQGTGLGLATVYGIVTQSGGWVGVQSEPSRGTTVTVYLPAAERDEHVSVPHQPASRPGVSEKGAILLVEDEPAVLRLAERVLNAAGYTVVSAQSPAEILGWLEEGGSLPAHDLLLTDVVLPGMDGWELAGRVRDASPATRVLFMSGYPRSALPSLTGRDDIQLLEKPFTPADLVRAVQAAFTERPLP